LVADTTTVTDGHPSEVLECRKAVNKWTETLADVRVENASMSEHGVRMEANTIHAFDRPSAAGFYRAQQRDRLYGSRFVHVRPYTRETRSKRSDPTVPQRVFLDD